jgi:hypothetical protein
MNHLNPDYSDAESNRWCCTNRVTVKLSAGFDPYNLLHLPDSTPLTRLLPLTFFFIAAEWS